MIIIFKARSQTQINASVCKPDTHKARSSVGSQEYNLGHYYVKLNYLCAFNIL